MPIEVNRFEDGLSLAATLQKLTQLLALDTGERIFAIDEERAIRQSRSADDNQRAPNSIAIIPIYGTLRPRGMGSMESTRAALASAASNPDVGAIVLDVDSPGGTYAGTPETGAAVRAAAQAKPVIAMVDTLAASAAYWIASQASSIVVSPSAEVGSIGVIALHLEVSKALENFGVTPTIMRSVPSKADVNMFEPLTDEARANVMASIDDAHREFIKTVAEGRKVSQAKVSDEFGKGRTVSAQRAVELGMADRVGTMADVLSGLRTKTGALRRRSALAFT